MKWLYIASMVFMSVSGGPFGVEDVLHKVPIYQAVTIVMIGCCLHMVPTGIMTYEMIQKHNTKGIKGGTIGWVKQTMGNNVGLVNAVYTIVDTAVDNAIYPVIIKDNLGVEGPTIPIVTCLACAFLNWKNTEFTGKLSVLQFFIIMCPFMYLLYSTPINDNMYSDVRTYGTITWQHLQQALMIVVWNVSGFDMAASYIHTLQPQKTDVKTGFIVAAVVTLFSYLLVLCCGTYYIHDKQTWADGSWSYIADIQLGELGRTGVQMASIVSSIATLCVELCATSHLWVGLVEIKAAPKIFASDKFNLVVNTVITILLSTTQTFETLVDLSAILNVATIVFESIAWLKTCGAGKFKWRLIMVFGLIIVNIGVSACISYKCIASIITVTVAALVWMGAKSCAKQINRRKFRSNPGFDHSRPLY